MNNVLVIDNNLAICKEIKHSLENDSTKVYYTQVVEEAIQMLKNKYYTLVILDVCLSLNSGLLLIQQIRQVNSLPILALSETASTADKVAALKMGADDFLNKPYDLEECLARAQALIRRYTQLNHFNEHKYAHITHGDLFIDTARRQVMADEKIVILTRKEYDILLYFIKNQNMVLTYEQIYVAVWREEYFSDNAAIFFHVRNLRKKLNADWIESRYGIGYFIRNPI